MVTKTRRDCGIGGGQLCLKVSMNGGNRKPVTVAVGHLDTGNVYWSGKLCSPLITSVVEFRQPLRRHKCLLGDQTISPHSIYILQNGHLLKWFIVPHQKATVSGEIICTLPGVSWPIHSHIICGRISSCGEFCRHGTINNEPSIYTYFIHTHTYIYIYIYTHIHTHTHTHIYIYIYTHTHTHKLQTTITQAITTINSGKLGSRKERELDRCWKSISYEGKHFNYVIYKRQRLTIIVSMGSGDPEVPNYPVLWGMAKPTRIRSHKYRELVLQVGRLARADLSP